MRMSFPTATRASLSLLMLCVLVGCGVERRGIGAFDGGGAGGSGGDAPGGNEVGAGGQGAPGALGSACATAGECTSGFCVDGVCCNSSCLAICEACAEPGSAGTCRPVTGSPRGSRPDCEGKATLCGGSCDGVIGSACRYPAAETECAAAACKNGQAVSRSVCSGS